MSDDADFLAREIAELKRRLQAVERGSQLARSSVEIEGKSVPVITALTSANGKNKNHYLPAATPPEDPAEGDLWFVTDEDNRLQRWDGDSWEPFGLGDAAISNLDAGSITTGTLSGALLAGEEIRGATIVGGTVRTADTGPRVVITEHTVTGLPGALEWHDDLNPGVGDVINDPPNVRGYIVDYPGDTQRYRLFASSGRIDEPGQAAVYLDSDSSDGVEGNAVTVAAKTITLNGGVSFGVDPFTGLPVPAKRSFMRRSYTAPQSVPTGTWTTLTGHTVTKALEQDGSLYTGSGNFTSRVAGVHFFQATVTLSATAPKVLLRWVTEGGTVLAIREQGGATGTRTVTCNGMDWLNGDGYAIRCEIFQDSGSTLQVQAGTSADPATLLFGRLYA